uniref:EGF-like domain-containing protein n=1 Tax=Ciona savignyi TaxID=51511 RepID=H2YTI3_CIOSA
MHLCDQFTTTCTNTNGSFKCDCLPGYEPSVYLNDTCLDLNECLDANACDALGPNSTCFNTIGSFMCGCRAGYVLNTAGVCEEVMECASFGMVNSVLENLLKKVLETGHVEAHEYQATLDSLLATGVPQFNIVPVNSSVTQLFGGINDTFFNIMRSFLPCDFASKCVVGSPSYSCQCMEGYQGDGFSCLDVNECTSYLDICDPYAAHC